MNSSGESADPGLIGAKDCPLCGGLGYLRYDLPVGDINFGKAVICDCRRKTITEGVQSRLFSISRLDELKDLTFDSFKPTGRHNMAEKQMNSLEWAYNHSNQYAMSLKGWLLIQGGYGCGKTHLAAAIANFTVQLGVPTLFLTVPDLLDTLRFSFDSNDVSFEERLEQIKNVKLLVLDDFGTQNTTGWAQEKLFQIINFRYINKLPLVVTTNLAMDEIEARLRSRLQDPELVTSVKINAPDYRRPTQEIGHSELSSLDLLSHKSFANFEDRSYEKLPAIESKSLETALKQAQSYARKPDGWLVLTGPYGCGKTHLAAAIANELAGRGDPPLFVMVPDLLDHLRGAFSPNAATSYDRVFSEVRETSLLILDDLGSQSSTPWAREKLYQLLNYRYNKDLPTIITIPVDMLKDVDVRIGTRIKDERICKLIEIIAPAYSGIRRKPIHK